MRTSLKTLFAAAALTLAFAANAVVSEIDIPATATENTKPFCGIDTYSHGTFLKVVATEQVVEAVGERTVTQVAEMYVANGLPVFLDNRQETMRLITAHCKAEMQPYIDIAKKAMKEHKTGFEKNQFSAD